MVFPLNHDESGAGAFPTSHGHGVSVHGVHGVDGVDVRGGAGAVARLTRRSTIRYATIMYIYIYTLKYIYICIYVCTLYIYI